MFNKLAIKIFTMTEFASAFWLIQIAGIIALIPFYVSGMFEQYILGDNTYITQFIAVFGLFGLYKVFNKDWENVHWYRRRCVQFGLFGTIIGILIAFKALSSDSVGNINALPETIGTLAEGIGTALTTTLIGMIWNIWLSFNVFFLSQNRED